jgi:hypothetical protein
VLLRNPEHLTADQTAKLAMVAVREGPAPVGIRDGRGPGTIGGTIAGRTVARVDMCTCV